jgi:hypothetical protein
LKENHMSDDGFNVFSAKDRGDLSYGACIGGTTALGGAVGRFAMLPGLLAGAATGLVIGLVTCKRLAPAIERKIFSAQEQLSETELTSVLRIIRDQTGVQDKADVMYLFSQARLAAVASHGDLHAGQNICLAPRVAASKLLSERV